MKSILTVKILWIVLLEAMVLPVEARVIDLNQLVANHTIQAEMVSLALETAGDSDVVRCDTLTITGEFRLPQLILVRPFVVFTSDTFQNLADFSMATFSKPVFIDFVTFQNGANFFQSRFLQGIRLFGPTFREGVNFSYANFRDNAVLSGNYYKHIILTGATFERPADLRMCNLDSIEWMYLYGINCPKLFIDWNRVKGRLSGSNFIGIDQSTALVSSYIFLEEQYRQEGKFDDMDDCYYERRSIERDSQRWIYRAEDWLLWATCGFGVRPWRTLWFSFVVIIIWSCFYFRIGILDRKHRALTELNGLQRSHLLRGWDALFFSANTFIGLGFGDWHSKIEQTGEKKVFVFRFLVTIEHLLGWLLLALFLVTYGRIMIR